MPLLNLVVILIVVGVALHLINRYIPMASSIKSILNVVVVIDSRPSQKPSVVETPPTERPAAYEFYIKRRA